jgi:hypothetical protein
VTLRREACCIITSEEPEKLIFITILQTNYFRFDFYRLSGLVLLDALCITMNLSMLPTNVRNAEREEKRNSIYLTSTVYSSQDTRMCEKTSEGKKTSRQRNYTVSMRMIMTAS